MNTRVPPPINREAEVNALGRALAVERRARYVDFRGRKSTFSQFMRTTADKLCRRFPSDSRWSTIRALFKQYPNLDIASRIAIIHRAEEILFKKDDENDFPDVRTIARGDSQSGAGKTHSEPAAPPQNNPAKQDLSMPAAGSRPNPPLEVAATPRPKEAGVKPRSFAAGKSPAPESGKYKKDDPGKTDVKFVKGVGPKLAEVLSRLGINTALDLIRHYPRHHLDFQNRLMMRELRPGQEVTVFGTIKSVGAFQSKNRNVSIITIVLGDGTGTVTISRFMGGKSNKFLLDRYKDQYPKGAQVMASGVVERDRYSGRLQLKNAELEILGELGDSDEELSSLHTNRLVPVYPLTEGIGLRTMRGIIYNALEAFQDGMPDSLPEPIRNQHELISLREAWWGIHFPEDTETKDMARRRLVFDELFSIQLQLACRRHRLKTTESALSLAAPEGGLVDTFRKNLPFKLTGAQERVFGEIAQDLAAEKPMHRLVQGDVGSGKTVVAAMATLIAVQNGYQAAVMAPTEILAEQHYRQFQKWYAALGLRCALFLGKQGAKERRLAQQDLLSGQVNVAIGTHALIQDEVEFSKLGLIVIDEQHRFGVKQRAKLKAKGYNPELLTMTATPIPRTLALTLHGDLDVSEIDELPPGRKPVKTDLFSPKDKPHILGFIAQQVKEGRQAYIVFPLIEESETLSAKAATAEYEDLKSHFGELNIGLMHGKLKPQEKDEVMDKFRAGEYHILVCTTVIEVGVDVPNASVMVIENADRFGLAQLHQLRGRVGRGAYQSYCLLVADANSETTRQRLDIMTITNDGFVVAEKDLELRGPGEFLGTRQSGLPDLFLADLVHDASILEDARHAAIALVREDPELKNYPLLKKTVDARLAAEAAQLIGSG